MTSEGWVAIIAALVTLVGAISAGAVTVIRALRENTAATMASTAATEMHTEVAHPAELAAYRAQTVTSVQDNASGE